MEQLNDGMVNSGVVKSVMLKNDMMASVLVVTSLFPSDESVVMELLCLMVIVNDGPDALIRWISFGFDPTMNIDPSGIIVVIGLLDDLTAPNCLIVVDDELN